MRTIHEDSIGTMRARGGAWAAYENRALDSGNVGHLQFLKIGEDCTYKAPPPAYPKDTVDGLGWRYRYVGMVDLVTGTVEEPAAQEGGGP